MKRILLGLLAVAAVSPLVAGCGRSQQQEQAAYKAGFHPGPPPADYVARQQAAQAAAAQKQAAQTGGTASR